MFNLPPVERFDLPLLTLRNMLSGSKRYDTVAVPDPAPQALITSGQPLYILDRRQTTSMPQKSARSLPDP